MIIDLPEGIGFRYIPNECSYEGYYLNGKMEGKGNVYIYILSVYICGLGVLIRANGEFYKGSFGNGMPNGYGVLT